METNPCLTCGACCAFFRASFYWAETAEYTPGGVPSELTKKLNDFFAVMKGSDSIPPRCIALKGEIGREVYCEIYENRTGPCREFEPSWYNGHPNPRCDRARLAWGLQPLEPDAWTSGALPKAA